MAFTELNHRTTSSTTGIFDYAPAPESRSVLNLRSSYGLFIDGEFVDPVAGGSFKSISPASEEVLAEIAEADATPTSTSRSGPPAARTPAPGRS